MTKKLLLTIEQGGTLADRIKQGDIDALKELYNSNLRFVVSVAKQYQDRGKSQKEPIEVGNKGLEFAARKFTPSMDSSSYLMPTGDIRTNILESLVSTYIPNEFFLSFFECQILIRCSKRDCIDFSATKHCTDERKSITLRQN